MSNNLKILLDNPKPFPLAFKYAKLILAPIEEYGRVPDQNKYQLEDQIGFKLRLANQKHLEVFSQLLPEITPTQFAVLAKLEKTKSLSQNLLGRLVGMDASTTQGVVHRLKKKGLCAEHTFTNRFAPSRHFADSRRAGLYCNGIKNCSVYF